MTIRHWPLPNSIPSQVNRSTSISFAGLGPLQQMPNVVTQLGVFDRTAEVGRDRSRDDGHERGAWWDRDEVVADDEPTTALGDDAAEQLPDQIRWVPVVDRRWTPWWNTPVCYEACTSGSSASMVAVAALRMQRRTRIGGRGAQPALVRSSTT